MCGRFSLFNIAHLTEAYPYDLPEDAQPRYNIAPSQSILAVIDDQGHKMRYFRWGLLPFWMKQMSAGLINARGETVDQKPSFRRSFADRRCLILADGFYEWRKEKQGKQPYRFTLTERKVFAFAGLWEPWTSPDGDTIDTCAIITTESNEVVRPVHDRMPVILPRALEDVWLDDETAVGTLKQYLVPYTEGPMEADPVSRRVNSPMNDAPDILQPPVEY